MTYHPQTPMSGFRSSSGCGTSWTISTVDDQRIDCYKNNDFPIKKQDREKFVT
jgi:hypothetical protein